jgi:hypothetical protein
MRPSEREAVSAPGSRPRRFWSTTRRFATTESTPRPPRIHAREVITPAPATMVVNPCRDECVLIPPDFRCMRSPRASGRHRPDAIRTCSFSPAGPEPPGGVPSRLVNLFYCQACGRLSQPGEKRHTVTIEVRRRVYPPAPPPRRRRRRIQGEGSQGNDPQLPPPTVGHETVREACVCPNCFRRLNARPET